jgi:hypothetical protein
MELNVFDSMEELTSAEKPHPLKPAEAETEVEVSVPDVTTMPISVVSCFSRCPLPSFSSELEHPLRGNKLHVDDQPHTRNTVEKLADLADQDSTFSDIFEISRSGIGLIGVDDDPISKGESRHGFKMWPLSRDRRKIVVVRQSR